MIQATFIKNCQTPAIAFSCYFSDEKGTALSRLVSVCSTANTPAQIAAWCFQLQGKMGFLQQGESSLLAGRFFHVFHLQSTVGIACMEVGIHVCLSDSDNPGFPSLSTLYIFYTLGAVISIHIVTYTTCMFCMHLGRLDCFNYTSPVCIFCRTTWKPDQVQGASAQTCPSITLNLHWDSQKLSRLGDLGSEILTCMGARLRSGILG